MKRTEIASEYQAVWMFAMFDLPVDNKESRKRYAQFRKELLREGFSMLQFSVYARYFASEEVAEPYRKRIRESLPPEGQVRLLAVTERQFGKQEVFMGRKREEAEGEPEQFLLF
jgi:CRISPR-associated protein Cas2